MKEREREKIPFPLCLLSIFFVPFFRHVLNYRFRNKERKRKLCPRNQGRETKKKGNLWEVIKPPCFSLLLPRCMLSRERRRSNSKQVAYDYDIVVMHMYALLGLISLSNRYLIHQAVESPSVQFLLLMPCIRTCVPKIAFSIGEGSLRCLSLYNLSSEYIFLNVTNKRGKNYSTFLSRIEIE